MVLQPCMNSVVQAIRCWHAQKATHKTYTDLIYSIHILHEKLVQRHHVMPYFVSLDGATLQNHLFVTIDFGHFKSLKISDRREITRWAPVYSTGFRKVVLGSRPARLWCLQECLPGFLVLRLTVSCKTHCPSAPSLSLPLSSLPFLPSYPILHSPSSSLPLWIFSRAAAAAERGAARPAARWGGEAAQRGDEEGCQRQLPEVG